MVNKSFHDVCIKQRGSFESHPRLVFTVHYAAQSGRSRTRRTYAALSPDRIVLDLYAAGAYYTFILFKAVGPDGVVYSSAMG